MAKITRHGGPTNASAGPGEPGHMPPPEVVEPEAVLAPVLVGEPGPELADFPPEPEPEPEVPAVDEAPAADDTAPAPTSRRNRRTN